MPEPRIEELDPSNLDINVILELIVPNKNNIVGDIFNNPDYWHEKGYNTIMGDDTKKPNFGETPQFKAPKKKTVLRLENTDQALDFYFIGLRKNPHHFACCFNAGVTYM